MSTRTFCRICEASCGLIATVEGGELVKLTPDREHAVTDGFSCRKGLAAVDVSRDPDRLDFPRVRNSLGEWADVSWEEAMATTATRLRAVIDEHGPNSVAAYVGNPMAFNALGSLHSSTLLRTLGVRRTFSSGTQDCANKFVASEAVFGTSTVHPIPDFANTDLCLIIGENPRVSQGSFVSGANLLGVLRRRSAAGARIVFVNPRRIETPERGVGDTIQVRPDTDVWFLAALLNEIDRLGGFDESVVARHGSRVNGLRSFIADYPPVAVEDVTGVAAATIEELARAWVATERASVHASTGLNMGRQGTLAYWLVHMLSFVTGRLDVVGGNLKSDGFYPNARAGAGVPEQGYTDTEFGRLRRGNLPGTLMSDAILDSDDPVRAMIVIGGNPLLSIAGQDRLRKAFESLELMVVVDIYPNATAEFADVVLPATDMYEREDLNIVNIGTSVRPFAQYTPAVVEPAADRRPEWWIAHRLLSELGLPSLLDEDDPDPWSKYRYMLERGSGVALADLVAVPGPVALSEPEPGMFYEDQVQTPDGRVDCCPPLFAEAIERCHSLFAQQATPREPGTFALITGRDSWMHNSWFANVPRMKRGGRTDNPLYMHPADMAEIGLADGDAIAVTSEHGHLDTVARGDESLMSGVVWMVHGWGHALSPGMKVAHADPGTNPNVLLPHGPGSFEPLSSQAHMTGVVVEVRPAVTAARASR